MNDITNNPIKNGYINMSIEIMSIKDNIHTLNDYLQKGNNNYQENIARLLTIATTDSYAISPVEFLTDKLFGSSMKNCPSLFLQSNIYDNNLFESDFDTYMGPNSYSELEESLTDSSKQTTTLMTIRSYYTKRLERKIDLNEMDLRHYETFIDLFDDSIIHVIEKSKGEITNANKTRH